ncbi:hypothetical protein AYO42_01940 [Rhizomicrobium sp. SCGC AG-212-E05]|nr:hypothetical protein AYO42_01940 [Rhizomicrobium sp. SCGC AG-212-E05]
MRFQLLAARTALAALILGAAAAVGVVAGVRLGLFPYATGVAVMWPATGLGLVALVMALLWLKSAIGNNDGTAKRIGLIALAGSLVFLYPPLSTVYRGFTEMPIHDASTDPDDPPLFVTLAKMRQPGMNSPEPDFQREVRYRGEEGTIAYLLHEFYQTDVTKPMARLMPRARSPMKTMFWRCFEIAKSLGWKIVDYSETEGRIEATAASFWFGQVSDIVIRVKTRGPIGARADVRAQSRAGAIDNGFNLAELKQFVDRFWN